MRRRRRQLSAEEQDLWRLVQATAVPLHQTPPEPLPKAPVTAPAPEPRKGPPEIQGIPADWLRQPAPSKGSVSLDLRPDPLAPQPALLDKRKLTQLKRGKLVPEARIDLHGLTQAEAHADLTAFLLASHQLGRRLVLVITGKGARERPRDGERGILRYQVPQWMGLSPLKQVILQVTAAHISHGGSGAFYVYLRRNRD